MHKYYIIGMPGSGKSTAAKELAKKLKINFFDLDLIIEEEMQMSISQIFNDYGEQYFRQLETKALSSLKKYDKAVVSCGGGIVLKEENKALMEDGIVIFLNPPLEDLKIRLKDDTIRPLLKTNSLDDLYKARFNKYELFKDIEVTETILSKVITSIIQEIKVYEKKHSHN